MEEVAGRGAPPSQPPARSTPSPAAPDLEPSASATAAAASTSVDRPSRTTQPTAPAQGNSGLALSIGPMPGAIHTQQQDVPRGRCATSCCTAALIPSLDVRALRRRRAGAARGRQQMLLTPCPSQRRIGSGKLSGQGTERYYFSGIARTTRKKPESYLVWYRDSNSGF